jgi:hypothetical protein
LIRNLKRLEIAFEMDCLESKDREKSRIKGEWNGDCEEI